MNLDFPFLIIYSQKFCQFWSATSGIQVRALALFPNLIILRHRTHKMNNAWIMHEKIHHIQTFESLGFAHIMGFMEYLYARVVLKKNRIESYFYKSTEQEAYMHQEDPKYLRHRPIWGFWKHVKTKPVVGVDENFLVKHSIG